MAEALAEAEKGRWTACPNPVVGAVLVRDGKVVARGFHAKAGEDHAEIACLKDARRRGVPALGATLVVTLEPCCHHGRTPPCTEAIVREGIARVVVGARDRNPEAAGGAERLRDQGVEVVLGVLEGRCRDMVADFDVWTGSRRPYVILKLAASLDGRIATREGRSRWITGEESRRRVHEMRAGVGRAGGAVLVGGGTFRKDDPMLTARGVGEGTQPLACVLASRLPDPDGPFRLLRERPGETAFFVPAPVAESSGADALRGIGCRVYSTAEAPGGGLDVAAMLDRLWKDEGCRYVLCEGGGRTALTLLGAGFVDEFLLHLAPRIFADDRAVPLFDGRSPATVDQTLGMRVEEAAMCGPDVHLKLRPLGR
ncbi:MAG: bifunctional diaminohydroxyphosphoribosylaminopyrimidine deaminase/5-amino-6-(5-phosphoribosylamino)uracil reductase RibD [Desulfovibrio sp.]|nr:bifunctional diaminohydroxyphosphoribosylaminopyrimidine deaminase/5-amino-6-(5-phosphoribosylamino)uracil reductase RibD [Desulfovibrio sp.]